MKDPCFHPQRPSPMHLRRKTDSVAVLPPCLEPEGHADAAAEAGGKPCGVKVPVAASGARAGGQWSKGCTKRLLPSGPQPEQHYFSLFNY
jgi:hypothetical protein